MDFSTGQPVEIIPLKSSSAVTESGKRAGKRLQQNDNKYYIQPSIGNEVVMEFCSPEPDTGQLNTVFLHVKGYYEHIRYFNHPPERDELETFRTPGKLSRFSYELLLQESDRYNQWVSSKSR